MQKIYLSCPYSHADESVERARERVATRVAATILKREDDVVVYSPITHSAPMETEGGAPGEWNFWKRTDEAFIQWADEVWVIQAKGVEQSQGVSDELQWAQSKYGMPVKTVDPVVWGTQIVGVSGKKRSGKDTFADVLAKEVGFEKMALADPIKNSGQIVFHFSEEQIDGSRKEEVDPYWEMTPREAFQRLGTDAFREEFGPNVWVKSLHERMRKELPKRVVVPDVRFPNELEAIHQWGGIVVRIDASERLDHDDMHPSEVALDSHDDFDLVVENNVDEAFFRGKAQAFAEDLETFSAFMN